MTCHVVTQFLHQFDSGGINTARWLRTRADHLILICKKRSSKSLCYLTCAKVLHAQKYYYWLIPRSHFLCEPSAQVLAQVKRQMQTSVIGLLGTVMRLLNPILQEFGCNIWKIGKQAIHIEIDEQSFKKAIKILREFR